MDYSDLELAGTTKVFLEELKKHNLSLSQFADLMDVYHKLPHADKYNLWKEEADKEDNNDRA